MRNKKTGNLKALNREQLINIASSAWEDVKEYVIRREFSRRIQPNAYRPFLEHPFSKRI